MDERNAYHFPLNAHCNLMQARNKPTQAMDNVHFWLYSGCNTRFAHLGWVPPPSPACGAAKCMMKDVTVARKVVSAIPVGFAR